MCKKVLGSITRANEEAFANFCYDFIKLVINSPEVIVSALIYGIEQFDLVEDENGKKSIEAKLYDKEKENGEESSTN
ncbi:hypothetical protein A6046_06950 [[Haemophilus] ducreyi]|uniref:Uncharacterized protein n=1 Tax=Haemophilus ducreyi TaxID=730 RepID=A0AAC8ZAQ8_HAEDC|nr:hypothetical protein [[Haemophilus] ducreyi]AKO31249.1 hypothetical protein RY60_06010 [[Haemophilus] ducreyi]AKO32697.1 hypothetical protein RZ57_06075 [[Haemophilus] ducreyi]AKO34146.1 hypothetical protein RZ58_06070 [[Haemophilus] ducreyi]AKO35589.1 hypothetical protein RZ59_06000 [[Haemophilus] ducreyi]AKO37045.1 hypothetical protein RZ61_06175 [[Haemophilus] ducreyi]